MSLTPDGCGLARVTGALFRGHSHKLNEYLSKALSYWGPGGVASLGQGAAIPAKSKPRASDHKASVLTDKQSEKIKLAFEAVAGYPDSLSICNSFAEFLG